MGIDRRTATEISERFQKASELCNLSMFAVKKNERLGQVVV